MVNIYKQFWHVNWAQQWQYRANLLMYLAYWIVSPITYLAVWTTIANQQGGINGMSAADFAAYYLTVLPVDILTACITIHYLAYRVQEGTLSNDLVQPVHPILTNMFVNHIAFKVLQVMVLVPIWIVLVILFQPNLTYTPTSLLLAIPAVMLGFVIRFLLESSIALLVFWTTRIWAVYNFMLAFSMFLNGAFVPLSLLPQWVQVIAQFLPFQLTLSFPVLLALNQLSNEMIALNFGLQVFWALALFGIFNLAWGRAIKQFSAVGA